MNVVSWMSKRLNAWQPSDGAIHLIKQNGLTDTMIKNTLAYLKNKADLDNIDDIDGYDNWNAFFIMFCLKASKTASKNAVPDSGNCSDA